MGQRLVINIKDGNGDILANGYYHWDAYTYNSAIRLEEINEFIKNSNKNDYASKKEYAVAMLESTGATLTEEFNGRKVDKENLNRNNGLIHISEGEINDTLGWAEGLVDINIDDEYVFFDVYFSMNEEEFKEERSEYNTFEVEGDFIFSSFEDLDIFIEDIKSLEYESYFIHDGLYWIPICG